MISIVKTILVTGSNKGIGFGILRGLLKHETEYNLILTSRSEERGMESFKLLSEELPKSGKNIFYHQLDITDEKSISDCLNWIKKTFGTIDVLVNNAGVATKGADFNIDVYNFTFPTNVDGTISLTEKMLSEDLIKEGGKIIVVGSSAGNIKNLSSELQAKFKDEKLTLEELLTLKENFRKSIIENKIKENGWTESAYGTSKMIINTYPRILKNKKEVREKQIGVYSCCPGWVRTDMAGPKATLSIEEGILTPIFLITLPEGINEEYQGKFFKNCQISSYYD